MRFHKYYFYLLFIISRESASCFFHTIHSFLCIFGSYEPQTREDFAILRHRSRHSNDDNVAAPHNASGWFSFHSFSCPQWKFLWLFIVFVVALHSFFPAQEPFSIPLNSGTWTTLCRQHFSISLFLISRRCRWFFLCGHWKGAREVSVTRYRKWYLKLCLTPPRWCSRCYGAADDDDGAIQCSQLIWKMMKLNDLNRFVFALPQWSDSRSLMVEC